MNKPTIKANRKPSSKRYLIEELIASDENDMKRQMETTYSSMIDETHTAPTIFASGAVLNKSVDINSKATIPPYIRRARSHTHNRQKLFRDEDHKEYGSMSDDTEDEEINISYYSSGAISTTDVKKPKIRNRRRAKTHGNITNKSYDYDSIWTVQYDPIIMGHDFLIDTVMEKPRVRVKRKHKTHNMNVKDLTST